MNVVFKPEDFKLLRKACPRYRTSSNAGVDMPFRDKVALGVYDFSGGGAYLSSGNGCYHSRPTTPTKVWN